MFYKDQPEAHDSREVMSMVTYVVTRATTFKIHIAETSIVLAKQL